MDNSGTGGMTGSGGRMGQDGMMSEQDMDALADAGGAEAARPFLQQMIPHHQGAIQVAQMEVTNGQNSEAMALAQTIVESQQAEIDEMLSLLASL